MTRRRDIKKLREELEDIRGSRDTSPTDLAPSRVLHGVWTRSLENYRTDPLADGSLRWARGVLVDDGADDSSPI